MSRDAEVRQVVNLVYGEPVHLPATEELAAARRVLSRGGMSVDRVRLMLLIVGSSPKFWGPMFEKSCARGYGVRRLEEQLAALEHALAKDPSAPGNKPRGGEDGYQQGPPEDEAAREDAGRTFAQKVADTQRPFLELIEDAKRLGKRGPEILHWVMAERARLTGQPPPKANALLRGEGLVKQAPKAQRDEDAPRHWAEQEGERE